MLPSLPPEVRRARIRSLTVSLAELDPIAPRSVALAPRPEGLEHPDQLPIRPTAGDAAQRDRSGRGTSATSDPAGIGASRTWRGSASVWTRSRAEPGPTSCDSFAFIFPGACRRLNDWKGFWRSIEKGDAQQAIAQPATRAATFLNRREASSDGWRNRSAEFAGTVGRSPSGRFRSLLSSASCATFSDRGQPLVPTRYQLRTGPFIIFSNFPMTDDPPAVRCLQALERDMKKHLDFRPRLDDDPVEIYVLDDRNAFAHFLKFYYPELPPRRAFFLAQGSQRVVYTYSSPRLEEDLRHEATHALLRGSFGDLPLWLDEGLAEYFETDLAQPGAERERIDHFAEDLAGGWSPNLPRLESLSDIRQMTPRDYREAWAWVHLFLNGSDVGENDLAHVSLRVERRPPTSFGSKRRGRATNTCWPISRRCSHARWPSMTPRKTTRSACKTKRPKRPRTTHRSAGSGGGCGR